MTGLRIIQSSAGLLSVLLSAGSLSGYAADFTDDIQPILSRHCYECHGEGESKGGFSMQRRSGLLMGGDSGEPAVIPASSDTSYLIHLISAPDDDDAMPPDGKRLTETEISQIREWIDQGAPTPPSMGPDSEKPEVTHWAFLPVQTPDFDLDNNRHANPIDFFIEKKLHESDLDFSEAADPVSLVRRLKLLMHGIPPGPDMVERFVESPIPGTWSQLVDEVMADPAYGEQLASLWLDIARFGETQGFETNRERPNAWPYRDWVINAFNADMPYNEFVRAQIAGDATSHPVGTAFLVAGPNDIVKGQDPKLGPMQRMNELDDMINTTGTAFLGLTLGCARCHNHKFDPVTQKDYYAIQAIFAGVQHADRDIRLAPNNGKAVTRTKNQIDAVTRQLNAQISAEPLEPVSHRLNEETFEPVEARVVRFVIDRTQGDALPCIDELEVFENGRNIALAQLGVKAESSGDFEHPLHKLGHINDGKTGNSNSWIASTSQNAWVQLTFEKSRIIDKIVWARDRQGQFRDRLPIEYHILAGPSEDQLARVASSDRRLPEDGDLFGFYQSAIDALAGSNDSEARRLLAEWRNLRNELDRLTAVRTVYAGRFEKPGPTYRLYRGEPDAPREIVPPGTVEILGHLDIDIATAEQERRLALAEWIASDSNPLTARVIVNRLWQFHFGQGIVSTPNDFGRNGASPTHPELLDWLAGELMRSGWSLKHINRLILESRTWRQSGRPVSEFMARDAGTRWLWRFPPRRLSAEGIRDSILVVAGTLNPESGGPGFSAFKVDLENVRHYHPRENFGPNEWRRMVYMTKVRQEKDSVFGAFDCPDGSQVIPRRSRSTTPIQALNLLNSLFVNQQADHFAQRLRSECGDDLNASINLGWKLAFGRTPSPDERQLASDLAEAHGLSQLTRAIFNANEFLFIP